MSLYFDLGANRSLSNLDAEGEEKFTDKQDTLVSGENIKTINGVSVLGEGNIEVGDGGTITVNQTYDPTSSYAQSGTAVAEGLLTVANKDLSNLSSNGQMVIDSQNGTISNCILEIPQNLNLTLENNVLTLKSGSILTKTGSTYATLTTTTDKTYTISSNQNAGKYVVLCQQGNGTIDSIVKVADIHSGTTAQRPEDVSVGYKYFNVDTKQWNLKVSSAWNENWAICYPICVIDVDSNHVASFAKDSNGNDMIFNGAGFVGYHAFVYPNVKALIADNFNADKTLKSISATTNRLVVLPIPTNDFQGIERTINIMGVGILYEGFYAGEIDNLSDLPQYGQYYVKSLNCVWRNNSGVIEEYNGTPFIYHRYDGTTVTDFTIRQPYEGARNLLTDDIEEEVATKQVDVTTLTGYDSTKTQTLKNVNGTLTWVDD